ncbi:MAG: carboxypeptidase-like regulatory domain-containing protein [Phycisphaerales bacterium]
MALGIAHAAAQDTAPAQRRTESSPQEREIAVRVTLRTFDQQPLPPLPMRLFTPAIGEKPESMIAFARTDPSGVTVLRGRVPIETGSVFVSTFLLYGDTKFTVAGEVARAVRDVESLRMRYYLPDLAYAGRRPRVDLREGVHSYEIAIDALPAVSLSGTVTSPDGTPVANAPVVARAASAHARTDGNGKYHLFGVPSNTANEVFVASFPLVQGIRIDAGAIPGRAADEARISTIEPAIAFDARVDNLDALRARLHALDGGLVLEDGSTLIRADGALVLTWLADANRQYDAPRRAPAGRYFVAPGRFSAHPLQLRLLDALRAGQDLSKSGVPMLEIPQSAGTALTVDAIQAADAIEKATPPLSDPLAAPSKP